MRSWSGRGGQNHQALERAAEVLVERGDAEVRAVEHVDEVVDVLRPASGRFP
jgi:predicted HAD superfamily Cof-like phosphohydrolase